MACMKARGFTLIELLVVISLVAALMALSVSALRRVREQAKSVVCQSNQRQLLVEFGAYEATHGSLPPGFDFMGFTVSPGGWAGSATHDRSAWWWFHCLGLPTPGPPGPEHSIIRCPSNPITGLPLKYDCLYGNYGVNWSLCRTPQAPIRLPELKGKPLCTSNLLRAAQTLLIVDSGYALIGWHHVTADPPFVLGSQLGEDASYLPGLSINHGRDLLPGQRDDALDGRHPNKAVNVGFADGHADRQNAEAFLVTKTQDGYTNLDPLWRPHGASNP